MSNLKRLAKLRQTRKGTNLDEYSLDELRQNWLAIEDAFRRTGNDFTSVRNLIDSLTAQIGDVETIAESSQGKVVFSSALSGSFPLGNIIQTERSVVSGNWSGGVYYPSESGTYTVLMGCRMLPAAPSGTVTNNLVASNTTPSTLKSIPITIDTTVGGSRYLQIMFFASLGPTVGISFSNSGSASVIGADFYCQITKG